MKHTFPYPLHKTEDANTGDARIGFEFKGVSISDATMSECSRFPVASAYYGLSNDDAYFLSRINTLVQEASEIALNSGARYIQDYLGVTTGDTAGLYFGGAQEFLVELENRMAEYICAEINWGDK
jgi:hypothetical protein